MKKSTLRRSSLATFPGHHFPCRFTLCPTFVFILWCSGLVPGVVHADCQKVDQPTGTVVTCTGIDNDGVATGSNSDTVTAAAGASVSRVESRSGSASDILASRTIATNGGNDLITNEATVGMDAELLINASDLVFSALGDEIWQEGVQATVTAIGIDSGTSGLKDTVVNNDQIQVSALASIVGGNLQLDLWDVAKVDATLTAEATAIGISGATNNEFTNNGSIQADAFATIISATGEINQLDWATAQTTITPIATSIGIAGGLGYDTISNTDTIEATANVAALSATLELNAWDMSVMGAGVGTSDEPMLARAFGIDAGDGGSTITNGTGGSINAEAIANASIDTLTLTLYDFTIATDFRQSGGSITTDLDAMAYGINSGGGVDLITNNGEIDASAESYILATSVSVGAEGVSSGVITNFFANFYEAASAGLFASAGTVTTDEAEGAPGAIGIASGAGNDTIYNTGSITADADATAISVGVSVSFPLLEIAGVNKWWNDFPPAIAIASAGTSAQTNAVGIMTGSGDDTIINADTPESEINVYATSYSSTTQASVVLQNILTEGGGAPYYLNFDLALASSTTLAASQALGIDSGSGNDYITNNGALHVEADATSIGNGATLAVEGVKGIKGAGVAFVESKLDTRAESWAHGIAGGNGDDTIYNSGNLEAIADAFANSTSLDIPIQGSVKGIGVNIAFADTSTITAANATGITGDAGGDSLFNSATGAESLKAHAWSRSMSEAFTIAVQGASTGLELGGSFVKSTTETTTTATGIDGGGGKDSVQNWGKVDVSADALTNNLTATVDVQGSVKGIGVGVAFTNTSSTSDAFAFGLLGGDDDDLLWNTTTGEVDAYAHAQSYAESFAVTVQASSTGVELGGALAIGSTDAKATATGMDGGSGMDNIRNDGMVDVLSEATTNNLAVAVDIQASVKGLGVGVAFTDGSSTAEAYAYGLLGGDGEDQLLNSASGTVKANADAESYAELVSLTLQGASTGIVMGGALAFADSTATALSSGIDGGAGKGIMTNWGTTDVDATATANSLAIGATIEGAITGIGAGVSLTEASTFANATATGLLGGDAMDQIINQFGASLLVTADANAYAESISLTVQGSGTGILLGGALAKGETTPTAIATGIRGGAGDDTLVNLGLTDVLASTDSTSVAVGVHVVGAVQGISVGAALSDTSTTATATALGIDGGLGDDQIQNSGTLKAKTDSNLTSTSVSFDFSGVPTGFGITAGTALAKAGTVAYGTAIGIDGGQGNDVITNTIGGTVDADAEVEETATAIAIAVNMLGYSATDTSTSATISAIGVQGGSGNNSLVNGGTITSDAHAIGHAGSYSLTIGVGGGSAKAGTQATATTVGMQAGSGADNFYNAGTVTSTAQAVLDANSVSFTLAGFSAAEANSTAIAHAIGIDAGEGNNTITNAAQGSITAQGIAKATAESVTVTIGVAGTDAATEASADVTGINTGDGVDTIINNGALTAAAQVTTATLSSSISLAGIAGQDSTPGTRVQGIVSGGGNDIISNTGSITIGGIDDDPMVYTEIASVGFLSLVNFSSNQFVAKVEATGIDGAAGNDTITNSGTITVGFADWMAEGKAGGFTVDAVDLFNLSSVGSTAETTSFGIKGGEGSDTLINQASGQLTVYATSYAHAIGSADIVIYGNPGTFATSTTDATATGISGGAGADTIGNAGHVNVQADTLAEATTDAWATIGSPYADSASTAVATATGLDSGKGVDSITNTGRLIIGAEAEAKTTATANSAIGDNEADADSVSDATAMAIRIGDENDSVINTATGNIDVASSAIGSSISTSDEDAWARSLFTSEAAGILLGAGNTFALNQGIISVDAELTASSQATAASVTSDAYARANSGGTARAWGIRAGNGNNTINNQGSVVVSGSGTATTLTTYSADYLDYSYAYAGTTGIELLADARGIEVGDGKNAITSTGSLTVESTISSTATSNANTISATNHAESYARGTAQATGISVGDGNNTIGLAGTMTTTATAEATANGYGEDYGWGLVGDEDTVGVIALAWGIGAGNGSNTIVNQADFQVTAAVTATALGSAHTYADDPHGKAVTNGSSEAWGIVAGNGGNSLTNNSTITVRAETRAGSLVDVSSSWGDEYRYSYQKASSRAVGVQMGAGNDRIFIDSQGLLDVSATSSWDLHTMGTYRSLAEAWGIDAGAGNNVIENRGTIEVAATATAWFGSGATTARVIAIQTGSESDTVSNFGVISAMNHVADAFILLPTISAPGTAIDTGAGNDRVILGAASHTTGDILLGEGDDILAFLGSAIINGDIDPGHGNDTLMFDGSGTLGYDFAGFDNAVKQGEGTFSLASLHTLQRLEVTRGTLALGSNYAMSPGSIYRTVVYSDGSHGQLDVQGTVVLDGNLAVSKGRGLFVNGTTYDIIVADAVENAFTDVTLPNAAWLVRFSVQQDDERVQIRTRVNPFTAAATDPLGYAVAEYLDRIKQQSSGDLLDMLSQIQNFESLGEFARTFHSLSPAVYSQSSSASIEGAHKLMQPLQGRMMVVRSSALAMENGEAEPILLASTGPYDYRRFFGTREDEEHLPSHCLWISGFQQWGNQQEDRGVPGYDFTISSGTIGYDHIFPTRIAVGAALSLGNTDIDMDDGAGDGTIDSFSAMLYGTLFNANAYLEAAMSYSRNTYDNQRAAVIGSTVRLAQSEHDGDVYSAYLGGGYSFALGTWSVGPIASLQYVHLDEEGFAEHGAVSLNLRVDGHSTEALVADLGLRAATSLKMSWGKLTPELRAGLSYDFGIDDRIVSAGFEGVPGTSFTIEGQDASSRLGGVIGCGLTLAARGDISTSLQYTGEFRDGYQSHGVMGMLRINF